MTRFDSNLVDLGIYKISVQPSETLVPVFFIIYLLQCIEEFTYRCYLSEWNLQYSRLRLQFGMSFAAPAINENLLKTYWSVSLIFLTQVLIEFSLIYVHRLAILNVRTVMRTTMF
jgi:hypothetical protein